MAQPLQSEIWTEDGSDLLSQPVINFFARRRVALSLMGLGSLSFYNLYICGTVPLNPIHFDNWIVDVALAAILLGLAIRSWAAGTLNKSRELTQDGPYALCRNPLYLGSFLMMVGFCLLLQDLPSLFFVLGPLTILYWLQVHFEEKRLLFLFPDDWPSYSENVPRLIPQLSRLVSEQALTGWTRQEWLRNREYNSLLTSLASLFVLYLYVFVNQSS